MLKKLFLLVLIFVFAVFPVFSGGEGEKTAGQPQLKGGSNFIQIKSSSIGGTWYAGGAAWAKLITDNTDYIATNSASPAYDLEAITRITAGRAQLGFAGGGVAYQASKGTGAFTQKHDISALFSIWSSTLCTIVHDGSDIKRLEDLKGKRVATYIDGDANGDQALELLKFHGITKDNATIYRISKGDAVRMFVDMRLDAVLYQYSPGQADLRQMATSRTIRFIPPTKDVFDLFVKENPFYYLAEFGDFLTGVKPELSLVVSAFTITNSNMDEEAIYQFTKVWFENLAWLNTVLPGNMPSVNVKDPTAGIPIKIHPGAIRYFKEAGIKY